MAFSSRSRLHEVAQREMKVVEYVRGEAFGNCDGIFFRCMNSRLRRVFRGFLLEFDVAAAGLLNRKSLNDLELAFVVKLEIFLFEIADRVTFFVADYHGNQNQV